VAVRGKKLKRCGRHSEKAGEMWQAKEKADEV
jgi:hypothetical protein